MLENFKMGRRRALENQSLPTGMYFNAKGKTYYLRTQKGDVNLGKIKAIALHKYYQTIDQQAESYTISDLIDRYMAETSPQLSETMHKTSIGRAKKLRAAFGLFPLEDLQTQDIQKYLDYRKSTPVDANRTVSLLRAMYTTAVRWGYIKEVPFGRVKFHKEVINDRLVTMTEVDALKEFSPSWFKLYLDLKFSTGLRQKDMLELTTENWNPEVGLLVQASKSKHRTCFTNCTEFGELINKVLSEASKRWEKHSNSPKPLFPNRTGKAYTPDGFRTMWHKYMQKAVNSGKLKESFREHDIRAMAATNRPTLEDARCLLGHRTASTTQRNYRKGYEPVMPNVKVDPKLK